MGEVKTMDKHTHMLVKTPNVPDDTDVERKVMEGGYELLELCADIFNHRYGDMYYSVKEIGEKLYDGIYEVYGEETADEVEEFDKHKEHVVYQGTTYPHRLNEWEMRKLREELFEVGSIEEVKERRDSEKYMDLVADKGMDY